MTFTATSLIYFCGDMAAMRAFYTDVLGLAIVPSATFALDEWTELDAGTFRLCLHKAGKPGSPPHNRNKLVFRVADVAAARAHLIARGVAMGKHHHWDEIDACDGRDPEGNAFQIAGPKTPA